MSAIPIYRDYDGTYRVDGYPELPFSTEADAENAAELAVYFSLDRVATSMQQERRYQKAAARGQELVK